MSAYAVRFHNLAQARETKRFSEKHAVAIELVTAEHMPHAYGVGPIYAMEQKLGWHIWVDVGAYPGIALAAIRMGLKHVLFSGDPRVAPKLEDMLNQVGGTLKKQLGLPEIELEFGEDAEVRLASYLGKDGGSV
ncbi:MAG: hypothetical protein AAFY56_03725 [Pseudomonadota bacterium]